MGFYSAKPSRDLLAERYGWFTAKPRIDCARLNAVAQRKLGRPLCVTVSTGDAALAAAGFEILRYKQRPIVLRRRN